MSAVAASLSFLPRNFEIVNAVTIDRRYDWAMGVEVGRTSRCLKLSGWWGIDAAGGMSSVSIETRPQTIAAC